MLLFMSPQQALFRQQVAQNVRPNGRNLPNESSSKCASKKAAAAMLAC